MTRTTFPSDPQLCQTLSRRGSSVAMIVAALGSLALLVLLVAGLVTRSDSLNSTGDKGKPLVIYCAASNKGVMEAIRADYEREFGQRIDVQYGPSQTLLSSAEVSQTGDLFLPADDSYLAIARERNLIAEEFPLAKMQAVVAVPRGNPQRIKSLDDLLAPELRLAQASPEATAIGKLTKEVLTKDDRWNKLHERTLVYKTTVVDVANDVKVGSVDAGIVFDVVLHDYPSLEVVHLPELAPVEARVAATVLNSSTQPQRALHFARYLSARDRGLLRYKEWGFEPVAGDVWSANPQATIYAGSMLRPVLEPIITGFEAREGAQVTRVYNGCGILVAQMHAGRMPDAYFACDKEFMNQVRENFTDTLDISQNELVILVKKGNPHGIRSLKDLGKPELRIGIGHEKQCAMGWLTQRTFEEGGVKNEVMKNVVVQSPTGDMLVNQMAADSLDAAVVYLSNTAGTGDRFEAVRIRDLPCSVATQPFGIAKETTNRQLVERLRQAILSAGSRERFADEGFQWIAPGASAP